MTTTRYTEGTSVTVSVAFTVGGVATDPTEVVFASSVNGQTEHNYQYPGSASIVKDSVGNYHAVVDTTGLPGQWWVVWAGNGACAVVQDSYFEVDPPGVSPTF